eukprot:5061698-Prymnesium_polylepis.1
MPTSNAAYLLLAVSSPWSHWMPGGTHCSLSAEVMLPITSEGPDNRTRTYPSAVGSGMRNGSPEL